MRRNKFIKKLLILFLIIALVFGVYTFFFSEKAENMNYYIDSSTRLISYEELSGSNIEPDKIDDLLIDLKGELSVEEITSISNKYNLSNILTDILKDITGQDKKLKVTVYEDLLINFEDNVTEEDIRNIEEKYNIKLRLNSIYSKDEKLYIFNSKKTTNSALIKTLNNITDEKTVEYAQPSYIYSIAQFGKESGSGNSGGNSGVGTRREKPFKPNDPMYKEQWNMKEIGMELAWNNTKGKDVTVAVIDTGVYPVEDLEKTEIVEGYNFVKNNKDAKDDHGHGTHVAGTIAQSTNNNKGVAGIAPEAKI
ncbi:MAG: S8 family serine peptidase, partial [Spirochaetota bacterium]